MTKRQSNRPDRRLANPDSLSANDLNALAKRLHYEGSANHKLRPGDYGFVPPMNPRPSKSPCDDLRQVNRAEALKLLRQGVRAGLVSTFVPGTDPKYVWAVDAHDEVYEAKTKPGQDTGYHGYRLGEDDRDMRDLIRREWKKRCQTT